MEPNNDTPSAEAQSDRRWSPLSRIQRRVVGVLIEKSKTTPDVYPMTVNAIRTGANQKSNRAPKMELENEQIEDTLVDLREMGAVIETISDSRVPKYKHRMYDWLGVDRAEMAVMAELLLRGEQTLGDLRARASRMEKIAGLSELKPIVQSLLEKGLMVELTPPGRGQMVTHNLYRPGELNRLKSQSVQAGADAEGAPEKTSDSAPSPLATRVEELEMRVQQLEETVVQLQQQMGSRED